MGAVRDGLLTLVIGGLFGLLVTAFAFPLVRESPIVGATGESPEARQYMTRRLEDPASLIVLKFPEAMAKRLGTDIVTDPATDVATRAMKAQIAAAANVYIKAKPVSLTYLGGGREGVLEVDIYAAELNVETPDGEKIEVVGYVLTLVNGATLLLE